ncbi:membrane-associated progesterone receptor component 1-like [Daktulosphaira vitifoliae]|uniref:membrane-associated progesterone receptor component 1-like n=1 Tax=Daktulosphaira vitifoliae TaxID=58002 RepID=UPI0021AAC536|nr:membrane-associated progesterone receptor component 1-like [Daktulosphaira vitifoliae]
MSANVGGSVLDGESEIYDVYSLGFWLKILINGSLIGLITYLLMKIFMKRNEPEQEDYVDTSLPKMKKRDFTIEELREFDGTKGDGRILVAINGKVFDVTKGKHFYGPGGVYSTFGGHDASRGLATFSVSGKDEYDDLSDLNSLELESMLEWETQFKEKYDYVGRLLKPGEPHGYYTDDEESSSNKLSVNKSKESVIDNSTQDNEETKTESNNQKNLTENNSAINNSAEVDK